ncbi:uncharacterized protein G2W53_007579 [Senna tora]|uniref:Uncharacterized protein n=1 Tax=Senna tora TaxID=362788 RepID=A0A834X789_9FABA|nr:uncharacterized protein G2W53_007579 [Senna tora]
MGGRDAFNVASRPRAFYLPWGSKRWMQMDPRGPSSIRSFSFFLRFF